MSIRRAIPGIAALCLAFLLAGCGADDEVRALRSDPMFSEPVPGLTFVDESESNGTDLFTGSSPEVVRSYSGPDLKTVQEAFEEILVKADEEGWTVDWIDFRRDGFGAHRDIDGYRAYLSVSILSPSTYTPTHELHVTLTT